MTDPPPWKTAFIYACLTLLCLLVLVQAFVTADFFWSCRYKQPRCLSEEGSP